MIRRRNTEPPIPARSARAPLKNTETLGRIRDTEGCWVRGAGLASLNPGSRSVEEGEK